MNHTDTEVQELIQTIRVERHQRRRSGSTFSTTAEEFSRYVWDPTSQGPYIAVDRTNHLTAVDVLGFMHDLGFHAAIPGAEAKALNEVDAELKRLVSDGSQHPTQGTLRMLVALTHRILIEMVNTGELMRVRYGTEGQA